MEATDLLSSKHGVTSSKYSEAIECYKNCLSMFQKIGDQEMIAQCYYRLGLCYQMLDKHSEAVLNYEQSLSIIVNFKLEKQLKAKVTMWLGKSLLHLNRFQEAKEYLDKALTIAEQIGGLELERMCNHTLSKFHYEQKQFQEALDYAERALKIATIMKVTELKQLTYEVLGKALASLGRVKEAISYLEQYHEYTKQVGNRKKEGWAFYHLSVCYIKIHEYDKAISFAEKSAEIAKETGDLKTEGKANGSIGNALIQEVQFKESMEYSMKQLNISKQTGDKLEEANAYNSLGAASTKLGKYYEANRYFETFINLKSELGIEDNNAATYNNLGLLYKNVGKYRKAAKILEQCLDIVKNKGEISIEIHAYQNLSMVYSKLNDANLAVECRWKSIILANRAGDKDGEIKYFQYLGRCFSETEKITEAITSHKKALHLAFKINSSDRIGFCYTNLGYTYFKFGKMDEAIHVSEKGLTICTDSGDKEQEAQSCRIMGAIYNDLAQKQICNTCNTCNDHVERNIDISEQYYRKSIQCYEELFDDLREKHEFKISIVDTYVEVYNELALFLIEKSRTTEALIVCERGRACALGDTLACKYGMMQQQQVFVENMSTRKPLNKNDLTDLVPNESSLLFYSIIDDSDHLWVLSQQQSLIYAQNDMQQNSITYKNITEYIYQLADSAYQSMIVRQMAANCEDRSLGKQGPCYSEGDDDQSQLTNSIERMILEQDIIDTEYSRSSRNPTEPTSIRSDQHSIIKEPLKELFKQLITPVQEHLTKDEVIIIPDGPLNLVPFAALQDLQTGRFLCETKRIRLAPSLTTLKVLKECPHDYHTKEGALIIGNPRVGEVMFRGKKKKITRLPAAEREARVVSDILSDILTVSTLIGEATTKDTVKQKLQEHVAVIHIAAHGDDATGEIALAPGISAKSKAIPEEEDYILTMQEVQEIGVRAKLVVLSCCHSGRGEIRAEGVIGMARAFLAAGARAVVASLWNTMDRATLDFMRHFYIQLKLGKSTSVSLNKSMKKMIEGKRYNHPKYWAPFFLIGDDVTIY